MPRPPHRRRVHGEPPCGCFKPAGVPSASIEEVLLTVDEFEALRLADFEGLYQADVAERMGVSRQTIGRILQLARGKVAEALVLGKALRIEGGEYVTAEVRAFACRACGHDWSMPFGGGRPPVCPACGADDICRTDGARGKGHCRRGGGGGRRGRGHGGGRKQ